MTANTRGLDAHRYERSSCYAKCMSVGDDPPKTKHHGQNRSKTRHFTKKRILHTWCVLHDICIYRYIYVLKKTNCTNGREESFAALHLEKSYGMSFAWSRLCTTCKETPSIGNGIEIMSYCVAPACGSSITRRNFFNFG